MAAMPSGHRSVSPSARITLPARPESPPRSRSVPLGVVRGDAAHAVLALEQAGAPVGLGGQAAHDVPELGGALRHPGIGVYLAFGGVENQPRDAGDFFGLSQRVVLGVVERDVEIW